MRNKRLVSSALIVLFLVAVCIVGGGCKKSDSEPTSAKQEAPKSKIPPQTETFEKALSLFDEEKYTEALPILEEGIKNNDPWCMNMAGVIYNNGMGGVKKDVKRGLELMQKAADMNIPVALRNLGAIHLNGDYGIPKNQEKGLKMLNQAIELNNSFAARYLGYCYETGNNVPQDYKIALDYYKKAKSLGDKEVENKIYNLEHLPNFIADSPEPIVREYEKNEVAADNKYKGKTVRITGRINDIAKGILDEIYITFDMPGQWDIRTVQCFFSDAHNEEISKLNKGQTITIQGTVDGLMMNVLLKDCWIVKE